MKSMGHYFAIPRVGIIRSNNHFQILYPQGAVAEMDQKSLLFFLSLHRQSDAIAVARKLEQEFNFSFSFPEIEAFLSEIKGNSLIDLIDNENAIEDPFDVEQVIRNISNPKYQCLTLADLAIFFTKECNYHCRGCSVDAVPNSEDILTTEEMKELVSQARTLGCLTLALTGGEPILPKFIKLLEEVISFSRKLGYQKVIVATNGYFLPRYIAKLKRAGVTRFSISFLGLDGYMKEYTGNPEASKRALEAIESCLKFGIHLAVNCLLTKQNLSQVERIVDLIIPIIKGVGHAYLRFSPIVEIGRAAHIPDISLNHSEIKRLIEQVKHFNQYYGKQVRLTLTEEDIDPNVPMVCDAGVTYLCVNEKGDVSPCDLLQPMMSKGNIRHETLVSIWNSDRWNEFRTIVPINNKCGNCDWRQSCFGKCKALSYLRYDSLDMAKEPSNCPLQICKERR